MNVPTDMSTPDHEYYSAHSSPAKNGNNISIHYDELDDNANPDWTSTEESNGETTPLMGNHANSFYYDQQRKPQHELQLKAQDFERIAAVSTSHLSRDHKQQQQQHSNGITTSHHDSNGSNMLYIPDESRKKPPPWKECTKRIVPIAASSLALMLCVMALALGVLHGFLLPDSKQSSDNNNSTAFPPFFTQQADIFDEQGRYIFEDYDAQTPFSDFLPGLSGIYGKPLYAFFVNRGQAIASFGVESKQTPIMEFSPANIAYQSTPFVGFRTFIQGHRGANNKAFLVEPFSPLTTNYPTSSHADTSDGNMGGSTRTTASIFASGQPSLSANDHKNKRVMYSGENEMQIQEMDYEQHLETNVTYFILPEEDFGAFVRRTTITNLHSREEVTLSVLDGLAKIQPAGGDIDIMLKTMGRTLEGFMSVFFPYKDSKEMPFFRLTTQPGDSDFVQTQERGHYCISILEKDDSQDNALLPIIFDQSKVFGKDTTLSRPVELYSKSVREIIDNPQYGKAKTSSCFAAVDEVTLKSGQSVTISMFIGEANHILDVPVIARRLQQEGFVSYKLTRTKEVIRQITRSVQTQTGSKVLDAHVSQMFLDNSLRGGIPIVLGDQDDNDGTLTVDENPRLKVYHVFSRIHGDLERDYNDFFLRSTFFSQGPGNFRDVVQNRRNDVIFQPKIGSFNVRMFLSFIQADGYEPLSVEAVVFTIDDKTLCDNIATIAVGPADGHRAQREALSEILNKGPFRPGQLFQLMTEQNIFLMVSRQEFIDLVAQAATSTPMAVYKKGFWADHWTYYLDMIESYLSIYPDGEERLMFETKLPYFFSPASVQPRSKKYVENLSFEGDHNHIQQLDATIDDEAKLVFMKQFITEDTGWYSLTANWQHDETGQMLKSSAFAKLFLLATLKMASRDPAGMGIEYEAGRPGWDDANNGIPGMLGSGMPETFELKALIQYLVRVARQYKRKVEVPVELFQLYEAINENVLLLDAYDEPKTFQKEVSWIFFSFWDNVSTAREIYRAQTKVTFSGNTSPVDPDSMIRNLNRWIDEIDRGINRAMLTGTSGLGDGGNDFVVPTYFAYHITNWKRTGEHNKNGHPLVVPLNMTLRHLPLFLEGPTRQLKTVNETIAKDIYSKVRNSSLYDKELKMYTVSASLEDQPIEMGRSTAFAPGWLENQSVWLHMSYKFYLQLLQHGMFTEFFEEVRSGGLLPFMDPKTYGRSPMQCSSFIASSAFEDPDVRGRGFLGRLSGSTSEFLSMWSIMFIGIKPFYIDSITGELRMQLVPTLPAWVFQTHDFSLENLGGGGTPGIPQVSFKLFSSITVRYHNEEMKDIIRIMPTRYRIGLRDGSVYEYNQEFIPMDMADKIRRVVFVDYIEVYF
jgi:hypothetical protein